MILKQRYNVMLNPRSMEILESYCRKLGISRSALIGELINDFVSRERLSASASDDERIEGQEVLAL